MNSLPECQDMEELRGVIDRIDGELVLLLGKRAACIDQAARIKSSAGIPAYIPERMEAVISNVRNQAVQCGADPEMVEAMWRLMIGWAVDHEIKLMAGSV